MASPNITRQTIAEQRLALERDKFELEKAQAKNPPFLQKHVAVIVPAAVTIVGTIFSVSQVWVAHIAKEREVEISRLQNEAEMDRRWRIEMLGFLERHGRELVGVDENVRLHAATILELAFPAPYVQPVRSKLRILELSTAAVVSAAGSEAGKVVNELLKPLAAEFD